MNDPPKLVDDCFRPGAGLLRHDEAIAQLRSQITPNAAVERVSLPDASGRILAAPAIARHCVPAHTNAAVDGYAFSYKDYDAAGGATLPVTGRSAAGHPHTPPLAAGSAIDILTGAVVPAGLDTVVMQEDCQRSQAAGQTHVRIPGGIKRGANVRHAGEDVSAGQQLFAASHILRPQDLASLASIGMGEVECFAALRVAIVSTGDEIVRPGERALAEGEVFDANSSMLTALVRLAGAKVTDHGIWADDRRGVLAQLDALRDHYDVVLTSGGASKGTEDHMASALTELGSRHFWEIAVKPGRPMMFGQMGTTAVVGLPGNPVAVFVCFLMYVYPMLRALGGAQWPEPRRFMLPAAFTVAKRKLGRREFWRGSLVAQDQGLAVHKFARDGSGLITGLRESCGLIDCPEERQSVTAGEPVAFIPFTEFGIV